MRKEFVFVLMFVLMLSLVAGAGYNVVVPSAGDPDTSSSGGGGGATLTNTTANETVSDVDGGGIVDDIVDAISDGVDKIKDVASKFGLKWFFVLIGGLAIIGGVVWYVLMDRRKKFVQVKVKDSGKVKEVSSVENKVKKKK